MNTTEKHTPGPWFAVVDSTPRTYRVNINPAGGFCLFTIKTQHCHSEQAYADARFIVRACNAHETQQAALENIECEAAWNRDISIVQMRRKLDTIADEARAALAKAEKE